MSLDISHLGHVTDILQRVCIHCPHLKHLNLGFDQVCSKVVVKNLSEQCPMIVSLNLEGTDALDPYESAFYPVANLPSLTKLNLSHCKWVNDVFMHDLALSAAKIEHVIIEGIPYVTDASMTLFLDRKHSHLKTLHLDGEGLTSSSFLKLGMCLNLEELSILFSENMTNLALEEIKWLKKLKRLHVRKGVDLTSTGIIDAFCNANLNLLTALNLGECIGVNDEVLTRIAPTLPNLKCIRIDWCFDVTNVGFDCILTNCPLLEDISIIGLAKLTSSALGKIPFLLPHLRLLDLQQCHLISDAIVMELVEVLPELKVLNYYGEPFQQTHTL